ncbi:MAG: hypothetical protein HS111_05945 [Kofleriaceae bacterium]|nr:hypothetical protein [Kofleriaceae bacterium]
MTARAALVVVATLAACGGRDPAAIAVLLEGQGAVEREHGGRAAAAPIGQPFHVGDAARTGAAAWARLRLRDRAVLRMGPDTVIRFVAGGPRLEAGVAEAETAAVTFVTEDGLAQLEAGGVLRATDHAEGVRFHVDIGRAILQREDGPLTLEAGAGIVVAIGGAIVERSAPPPPPSLPAPDAGTAPAPPPPPPSKGTSAGPGPPVSGAAPRRRRAPRWPPGRAELGSPAERDVRLAARAAPSRSRAATIARPSPARADRATGGRSTAPARHGSAPAPARAVQARAQDVAVAVPGGVIVTRAGGDAALDVGRRETVAEVERGQADLDGERSDASARAGETGVLSRDGDAAVRDPAPTAIDVALPAGEHAVVHDPARKVAIQIDLAAACPAGGVLELADGRGSFRRPRRIGGARAAFFATGGTTRYRVRCDGGGVAATGSVRVVADSGAAPVVRTPPVNLIETDGRKYSVTYQNRLPALTISWREAPGASTLHVQAAGGAVRTFEGSGRHQLAAGTLAEGSHTVWITAGARSSPRTTVRIGFDNAAPTAQITAPPARAAWADTVAVSGVTVEGWSVAVDGRAAERDGSGRFRATVEADGKRTFAIRLAHPQHGVHYYLRRRR